MLSIKIQRPYIRKKQFCWFFLYNLIIFIVKLTFKSVIFFFAGTSIIIRTTKYYDTWTLLKEYFLQEIAMPYVHIVY